MHMFIPHSSITSKPVVNSPAHPKASSLAATKAHLPLRQYSPLHAPAKNQSPPAKHHELPLPPKSTYSQPQPLPAQSQATLLRTFVLDNFTNGRSYQCQSLGPSWDVFVPRTANDVALLADYIVAYGPTEAYVGLRKQNVDDPIWLLPDQGVGNRTFFDT